MNDHDLRDGDLRDGDLRKDVRALLADRDRREHAPAFAGSFAAAAAKAAGARGAGHRSSLRSWGPALAASVVAAAIVLAWAQRERRDEMTVAAIDPAVVEKLSSPDYWRVPSDALLAQAPRMSTPELPTLPHFEMSLEESVL